MTAAAILTWTGTAVSALFAVLMASVFGPVAFALLESFEPATRSLAWVGGTLGVFLILCGVASVSAYYLLRGRAWARWLLIALSTLTAVGGALLFVFFIPLLVSAAAVAVVVLLLVSDARAWFAAPDRS